MLNKHCSLIIIIGKGIPVMYCAVDSVVFHVCCSWLNFLILGFLVHWHCTFFSGMGLIDWNV